MPFSATHENHVGILMGIIPPMSTFFSFSRFINLLSPMLIFLHPYVPIVGKVHSTFYVCWIFSFTL